MHARIETLAYLCFSVVILLGVGVTLSALQRRRRWKARAERMKRLQHTRTSTPGISWPCECPCCPLRLHANEETIGCLFGSQWPTGAPDPAQQWREAAEKMDTEDE